MNVGRKRDVIWTHYTEISAGNSNAKRAKCLKCDKVMACLVKRMRKHFEYCNLKKKGKNRKTERKTDETCGTSNMEIDDSESVDSENDDRSGNIEIVNDNEPRTSGKNNFVKLNIHETLRKENLLYL